MKEKQTNKVTLNKYEVSTIGMLLFTLLPTIGVMAFQAFVDAVANAANIGSPNGYSLHNYRIYIVTAAVFLLTLTISAIFLKRYAREIRMSGSLYFVVVSVAFCIHIFLLVKCYLNSPTVYPAMSAEWFPWHNKTNWKVFLLMAGVCTTGIFIALWTEKEQRLIEILRYPAYLAASVMAGVSMYCGNFLASDKMHGNAYYTSVYNAVAGAPYNYSNQSIYGHYAIFLKYPVKWLGGDYTAFNIVMAIVGAISLFAFALTLDVCLKNHFISVIGTWSILVMYFYYPMNHWQMFPHRVLFAGIELYLLARYFHKPGKCTSIAGYIVCSLALLWNVETGVICLGVWGLAGLVHDAFYIKPEILSWKILVHSVFRNAIGTVLSVVSMVLLFNLYNMPLGEGWHGLRFLLFPHISNWDMPEKWVALASETRGVNDAGMVAASGDYRTIKGLLLDGGLLEKLRMLDSGFAAGLSNPFPVQISAWYFVFFLLGAAVTLFVARKLYKRARPGDYVMCLAAVLALGQLVYFVNRPCFDYLAIAFFEAVLIMGILVDESVDRERKTAIMKRGCQFLFIGILSVLSVLSIWQILFRMSCRIENGYYAPEKLETLLEEIRQTVPENTLAFGQGIQEIYAQLGWDTGCYFVDYSSLGGNVHSIATIIVEASVQSECVISVREIKDGRKTTAQQYMWYWGFPEESVTVKKHWDMGMDYGGAYWDIYYIGIDQNVDNQLVELYEGVYETDHSTRWKE